jgi:hypothetical protein
MRMKKIILLLLLVNNQAIYSQAKKKVAKIISTKELQAVDEWGKTIPNFKKVELKLDNGQKDTTECYTKVYERDYSLGYQKDWVYEFYKSKNMFFWIGEGNFPCCWGQSIKIHAYQFEFNPKKNKYFIKKLIFDPNDAVYKFGSNADDPTFEKNEGWKFLAVDESANIIYMMKGNQKIALDPNNYKTDGSRYFSFKEVANDESSNESDYGAPEGEIVIAVKDIVYFYENSNYESKTSSYFSKGQKAEYFEISDDNPDDDFLYVNFERDGKVKSGYILRSDVKFQKPKN